MSPTVLVQGAGDGGGNNLIRSIRMGSFPVRIIGSNADRYALAQSLADRSYLMPRGDAPHYGDALRALIAKEGIDLVIPNNDTEVGVVSRLRDSLGASVLLPGPETVDVCQDKFLLNEFMARNGFRTPATREVKDVEALPALFAELGGGMLWCRPRRGSGSKGALPVRAPDQAQAWIRYWQVMRNMDPGLFLLSEYLPGRDFAFQSLWHQGELVVAKTVERIDYLFGANMPSGTSSSPRVGRLTSDPRVNELCTAVVRALDPRANGMFCIDLKEAADKSVCITEINIGRFFMITLAMNSVGRYNMAELYLRQALGQPVTVPPSARYSDIGAGGLLIRTVDNEPTVITDRDLAASYVDFSQGPGGGHG